MVVNWISLGLRMPTENGTYLVTIRVHGGPECVVKSLGYDADEDRWDYVLEGLSPYKVTHWADMPQPAQPEPIQVGADYTRADLEARGWTSISFEQAKDYDGRPTDGCYVMAHGVYEESSVLAGQHRKVHLQSFDTFEAAKAAYPFDDITQGATGPSTAEVPLCPPSDWSPDDAGEAWGEDDY